jgi:YbbR domain-containing protein
VKLRINNRDIYLRGLALLIAVIFWIFAQQDMQVPIIKENEHYQKIMKPVVFANIDPDVLVTSPAPEIFLEISGPFWQLNQKQDEIVVVADLERKGPGRHTVKIEVRVPEGLKIDQYYPDKVDVKLEKKETRKLKVEPVLLGTLPVDLAISTIDIVPQQVVITGPQSYISQADKAFVALDLTSPRAGKYKQNLKIQIKTHDQKTLEGLALEPQLAKVEWDIIKQEGIRVPVKVVMKKKEDNLNITVNPQEVLVFSNKTDIKAILTEPVSYDKLPYQGEIALVKPKDAEIWPTSVKVSIEKNHNNQEAR